MATRTDDKRDRRTLGSGAKFRLGSDEIDRIHSLASEAIARLEADVSDPTKSVEHDLLVSNIITYLLEGQEIFLVSGALSVPVRPANDENEAFDKAVDAIQQLRDLTNVALDDISIQTQATGVICEENICDSDPSARINLMFSEKLPENIASAHELRILVEAYLEKADWRGFFAYLERLPPLNVLKDSQRANVESIVIALLEAGELGNLVPNEARNYLLRNGYSEQSIAELFDPKELKQREAFGSFYERTGTSPNAIVSLAQLHEAIASVKCGPQWTLYCDYLSALGETPNPDIKNDIVIPLRTHQNNWIRLAAESALLRAKDTRAG